MIQIGLVADRIPLTVLQLKTIEPSRMKFRDKFFQAALEAAEKDGKHVIEGIFYLPDAMNRLPKPADGEEVLMTVHRLDQVLNELYRDGELGFPPFRWEYEPPKSIAGQLVACFERGDLRFDRSNRMWVGDGPCPDLLGFLDYSLGGGR